MRCGYKSTCPVCGQALNPGDEMDIRPDLGAINNWVHTKTCLKTKLATDFIARFKKVAALDIKTTRELGKALKIAVTRDGRYIDPSELRYMTASYAMESFFDSAYAFATGETPEKLPAEKIVIGGTDEEVAAIIKAAKPGEKITAHDGYVPVPDFEFMADAAEYGENIFMVGPSGSGKTETAKAIAKKIEAELVRQNFDGDTTTDLLIGSSTLASEDGASVTKWQDGELARACRMAASGKKVIYLADEVQAGKPEVLFKFHRVMELDRKTKARSIEINGEVLYIPKGMLTIIGTGNSFRLDETGLYQGSNAMNMAFCNRWSGGVFFVDYAPNEEEILAATGIPKKLAEALVHMGRAIRVNSAAESTPVVCSTRQLINIGEKAARWGHRKAIELVYLNTLLADERKIVDPVVKTYFK